MEIDSYLFSTATRVYCSIIVHLECLPRDILPLLFCVLSGGWWLLVATTWLKWDWTNMSFDLWIRSLGGYWKTEIEIFVLKKISLLLSIASNCSNSNSQFYWSFPKIRRMGLGFYFCFFLKGYTRRLKDDTYWLLSQDHSSSFIELQACIFNHALSARMNLLWAPDYKLHQRGENKILVGDLISSEVWLETV